MSKPRKSKVMKRRIIALWRAIQAVFVIVGFIGLMAIGTQLGRLITHTPANCVLTDDAQLVCH